MSLPVYRRNHSPVNTSVNQPPNPPFSPHPVNLQHKPFLCYMVAAVGCLFSVFLVFTSPANTFRLPPPTKKGDPRPVGLKTHATTSKESVSEGREKKGSEERESSYAHWPGSERKGGERVHFPLPFCVSSSVSHSMCLPFLPLQQVVSPHHTWVSTTFIEVTRVFIHNR